MLLRQLHLDNNLSLHIKENINFHWQRPQQLPGAKADFEGWNL